MSKSWAGGSTTAHRKARRFVLLRDGERCRAHKDGWCARVPGEHVCLGVAPLSGPQPGHAHHTHGKAVTGDDPAWMVAACAPCNLHIGDPTKHADPPPQPRTRW
jgi:hypothetical protein